MGRRTTAQTMRVVTLRGQRQPSLGVTEIVKKLATEGITITRAAVYAILKKYNDHKTVSELPPHRDREKT